MILQMFPITAEIDPEAIATEIHEVGSSFADKGSSRSQPLSQGANQISHRKPSGIIRLEDCFERYCYDVRCNICGGQTSQRCFHCSTCMSGNFDLCPQCFSEGVHCLEDDYYLREIWDGTNEENYHSSVQSRESGKLSYCDVSIRR